MSAPVPAALGIRVLLAVSLSQGLVALANSTLPAIAPRLATALGVDASMIGYQVSLLFGTATFATSIGGWLVARHGACRTMQLSSIVCALGLALAAVPSLAFTVAGTILIGVGLGVINSPAAHLLVRFTPPERRNFYFSLKQTGVPVGGMIASLVAPVIAVKIGWQWSVLPGIAWAVLIVLALQLVRERWDDDRDPAAPLRRAGGGGVATVWGDHGLRWVSLTGFAFSAIQRCVLTFTVAFLVTEAGYGLIEAGVLLSVVQAGGICGRPFWGWVADRTRAGNSVLILIGTITIVGCVMMTTLGSGWPVAGVAVLFFLLGATSVGWNGVLHAETTRLSPPGMIGAVAAGSSALIFAGVLAGPSLFALIYRFNGSYTATFWLATACGVAGTLFLLLSRAAERRRGSGRDGA